MNDIIKKTMLSKAAWLELEGAIKSVEAAMLRDDKAGVELARQKAHDMLDSHLDLKCDALIEAVKAGKA